MAQKEMVWLKYTWLRPLKPNIYASVTDLPGPKLKSVENKNALSQNYRSKIGNQA
jgi:hypothetical protein